MAFCPKCGSELVEGMAFCVKCGAPVPVQEVPNDAAPVGRTVPLQQSDPYPGYNAGQPYQAYEQPEYYAQPAPPAKKGLSTGAKAGIIAGAAVVVCGLAFGGFMLFQSLDRQTVVSENVLESMTAGNSASNQGQAGGNGAGSSGSGSSAFPLPEETSTEPEATETKAPETSDVPKSGSSDSNPGGLTRDTLSTETTTEPTTAAPTTTAPTTTAPATTAPEPNGAPDMDKLEERYLNLIGTRTVRMYIKGLQIVYTSKDLDVRGTVTYGPSDASCVEDERVQLLEVKKGSKGLAAYIEYSSQISGTARGYIPMDIITQSNGDFNGYYSSAGFYVIWTKGDSYDGSHQVGKGEMVYFLSDEGSGTYCIMYPMDAGGWQIGYCRSSDYNKYVAP